MTESFEKGSTPEPGRLPRVGREAVRAVGIKMTPGWGTFRAGAFFDMSRQNNVLVAEVLGAMYNSGKADTPEREDAAYTGMFLTHELLAAQAEIDGRPVKRPPNYRLPIVRKEISIAAEADAQELGIEVFVAAITDTIVEDNPRVVDNVRRVVEGLQKDGFYTDSGTSGAASMAMQLTYMMLDRQALADEMNGAVFGPPPGQPPPPQ